MRGGSAEGSDEGTDNGAADCLKAPFVVSCGRTRCCALAVVGGVDCEIDMFLPGSPDIEGRYVNELASNANVALPDQDTSMMDGLGQTLLVNLGLETTFQQLLSAQL
jgi:hypothetical protein